MGEWGKNDSSTYFGDGVNWDAVPHQQLWDWFSQPQLGEMESWIETFTNEVGGHFQAAADKVNEALRTAGVHWEGSAADSMQEASAPLAAHALVAKDAATSVGETTLSQVMAASEIALAMPEPKPAPKQADLLPMLGSSALPQYLMDVHEQEKAATGAEERARDLARSYDAGADDAVGGLPQFEKAPQATVAKAEPGASIEVPDPRPTDPGPGGEVDGGPGIGSGPGYTSSGPDGTPSQGPVAPQGGDGQTSGQNWTPQTTNPTGGLPPGSGTADTTTPRPTSTAPVTGGLVSTGSPGPAAGGPRAGGRSGQVPGGKAPGGLAAGERAGGRGGAVPGEGAATARAGAGGRGGGMGMAPAGAGRGKGEDDVERTSPDYLRDYNDEFWDDTPPVAPAVIGDDEDDQ